MSSIDSSETPPTTTSGTDAASGDVSLNKQYLRGAVLVAVLAVSVILSKNSTGDDNNNTMDGTSSNSSSMTIITYLRTYHQHELILIHLLSFASWFGCTVWVSFIAGIVMFKNLPRHTFGRLQSKLFPSYFLFSAICIFLSIGSSSALIVQQVWDNNNKDNTIHPLFIIQTTILFNLLYLEPQTTSIMFQRHVVERKLGTGQEVGILKSKDPAIANNVELKRLSKQFGMYHGLSTTMNLIALGVGCYWMNTICQSIVPAGR